MVGVWGKTHPQFANLILRLPLRILLTPGALICSLASTIPRLENGKEMSATQATLKEVSAFKEHKQYDHIISNLRVYRSASFPLRCFFLNHSKQNFNVVTSVNLSLHLQPRMRFFYHLLYNPMISSGLAFVQKSSISIDYLIIVIFWGGGGCFLW